MTKKHIITLIIILTFTPTTYVHAMDIVPISECEYALLNAADKNDLDAAQKALDAKARVDVPYHETPLIRAAKKGHREMVELLLQKKAHINTKDSDGATSLWWATYDKHAKKKLIQLLLDNKADVETRDNHKRSTPLKNALEFNHIEIAQLLIDYNAPVNISDRHGLTPLMTATFLAHPDMVQILLDKKADPNIVSRYGDTALSEATGNNHADILRILIDNNADTNARNQDGLSPLDYATFNNADQAVMALIFAGANPHETGPTGLTPFDRASPKIRSLMLATCQARDLVKQLPWSPHVEVNKLVIQELTRKLHAQKAAQNKHKRHNPAANC